jgi:hypothetical protein
MLRSTAIVFKAWAAAFYGSTTLLGIGIGTTIGQDHDGTQILLQKSAATDWAVGPFVDDRALKRCL